MPLSDCVLPEVVNGAEPRAVSVAKPFAPLGLVETQLYLLDPPKLNGA
jgi:hypothetical protein